VGEDIGSVEPQHLGVIEQGSPDDGGLLQISDRRENPGIELGGPAVEAEQLVLPIRRAGAEQGIVQHGAVAALRRRKRIDAPARVDDVRHAPLVAGGDLDALARLVIGVGGLTHSGERDEFVVGALARRLDADLRQLLAGCGKAAVRQLLEAADHLPRLAVHEHLELQRAPAARVRVGLGRRCAGQGQAEAQGGKRPSHGVPSSAPASLRQWH